MTTVQTGNIDSLWSGFLKGDDKSFSLIYFHQINRLMAYGYKLSPDREIVHDAIQEVFLDLYQKRGKSGKMIKDLKGYLFSSIKHSILKKLIGIQKLEHGWADQKYEEYFQIEYEPGETGEANAEKLETKEKLNRMIGQLSPREKEIIYLKFEEELDYVQISEILEITVESCHKQFYRAMKDLRSMTDRDTFLELLFIFFKNS